MTKLIFAFILAVASSSFAQTAQEAKLISEGKCIPYRAGVTGVIKKYMCHQDGSNPAARRPAKQNDDSAQNSTEGESFESAARPMEMLQSAKLSNVQVESDPSAE